MDATQMISDSILESDDEDNEEEKRSKKGQPLAKLCILKNEHVPETELPLFLGDNVLGRDPNTCTLPLQAPSVSKQHATICISAYRRKGCLSEVDIEALVWDLGSMNGTRKGRIKLTPNVRYALSEQDSLVVADIPCQYFSCAVDRVSSQVDARTPMGRNAGLNAGLLDASGEKRGDTSISSKKCVNGSSKARVSVPGLEDTRKTPVRPSCLSFEQTPNQPQGSLVPESDSDSDGERGAGGERRRKALVSNSDSCKSGPTCSTFLSPANKIVPESEDESPITPSSSTKNRPYRHVSFSKEETDIDMGRQQLTERKALAIMGDSEEEGGSEEERAALAGRKCEKSGQHVPVKQDGHVSLTGEDDLPVFTPAVVTDVISALNMDSDTDVEEQVPSVCPVTSNTTQQADQPPEAAHFHMDSDTDADEDNDALDKIPKSVLSSADTKPPHVIKPEGITMDSDTDVDDDDDDAVSDTATKAKPVSFQSTHTADSALLTQPKDFHLDSDTDVDEEEEEKESATNTADSKNDQTPTKLDIKPSGPESAPCAHQSSHPDSDTDDEATPAPVDGKPSTVSAVTESYTTADKGADLPNSDTDVEDRSPLVKPVAVPVLSVSPDTRSAPQLHSDADTDVDEPIVPPAGDRVNPADLGVGSDTDVEDKEVDLGEAGEGQVPSLCRENTPGLLVPLLQNCSTPVQLSEEEVGEVEEMETQAFLSPASGPRRRAVAPAGRPKTLSSLSDSTEDEDFVVAETQSFVLQIRDCQRNLSEEPTQAFGLDSSGDDKDEQFIRGGSFQLGLSDSSHLQTQAQALAMESTQAFVSVEGGVTLEDTQAYAATSNKDRTSVENEANLEATQDYVEDDVKAECSVRSKKGQVDFAMEATQAYISEPCCDSEDETDEDERKSSASAETQPLDFPISSTLAIAETQPMSAFEVEENLDEENLVSILQQDETRAQDETEETGHGEDAPPQEGHISKALSVADTQPMCTTDNGKSDEDSDEDSIVTSRKRKAKLLQLEEEQTQTLTNSDLSVVETQPMATAGDAESDEEDSVPGPRKRKAKQHEEETTQPLTFNDVSDVETQQMVTGEDGRSDDEDSIVGPRKRKPKRLQIEDESQTLTNSELSAVEAQPMGTGKDEASDEEDSFPSSHKRKAKPLQIQEEESQSLPNSGASTVETQPLETNISMKSLRGTGRQPEAGTSGVTVRGKRETRSRLREEEEECSEPPKRQTRGKNKALPTTRGRKGISRPDEDKSEEEQEEEQAKLIRGKKSMRHPKDNKTAKERLEKERNKKEQEKIEMERDEKERERLQAENAERLRLEQEIKDKERKEQEEKKRAERAQKEKEQLERERKEKEEIERLEREKAEKEEKAIIEKREREEQEERARLESEAKEREERERLEREKQEKEAKGKQIKEQQENKEEETKTEAPARSRRAARRTIAAPSTSKDSNTTNDDDVPARRTRSRSNSSNSVSSERSASSANTQESRGRGRGRGAKRTSVPPPAATPRNSNRRRTVAAGPSQQDNDISPQGVPSRSNSTISLNSEISSCRGRGGRQRGRGRKLEADSVHSISSQSDQSSTPKPTSRGRKSRKAEDSSVEIADGDDKESQQASTTRGRQRVNTNDSELAGADKEGPSNQDIPTEEESVLLTRNVRGRGQTAVKSVEAPVASAVSNRDETKRKGKKRDMEENTKTDSSSSSKMSKGSAKEPAEAEEAKVEIKEAPAKAKRRGRASSCQAKKETKDSPPEMEVAEEGEKMEEGTVERRGRGRPSVVQKKKKEEQEESGSSVDQDAHVEASEPKTPTSSVSRKRQAPAASSPVAKTPRSSSASPAAGVRAQAASQAYKVLFTGVVDEAGERVLARLGGRMAKGVADMNCLVTDKIRRTVKFLCAVAKGVPIVTTHWLEKSGKAGSFLPPNAFVVKDPEQEKKFSFCLQESLRTASSQPLLQGYEIHVTKSVKPEPVHMKDIISCSGATFLPKMPSSQKPQTVVISCEEDLSLCGPALSASLPVVSAEFILTGILQQKLDLQTHSLSVPASNQQPTAGRGRGRKKT